MPGNEVTLSVRTELSKIIDDLDKIAQRGKQVEQELAQFGKSMGEGYADQVNQAESMMDRFRTMTSRVVKQISDSFKTIFSLNAVRESLRLSDQFRSAVKESFVLNDTIRKLGTSFGIADREFSRFQSNIVSGLGKIGLSSDVASRTLKGLYGTPVHGQGALVEYAQISGQLASISATTGQEGQIAKGIAGVIRARGGDPNDRDAMRRVAEDVRRVFNVTREAPAHTLQSMETLFTRMPQDLRREVSTRGLAQMASIQDIAGPNATLFFQELLSKSPVQRLALEQQGFSGMFDKGGINLERFGQSFQKILGRFVGDPRLAAQTLGISEDAAEGAIRMNEHLKELVKTMEKFNAMGGNLGEQYKTSLGFGEAFRTNIAQVQRFMSPLIAGVTEKGTEFLSATGQSPLAAAGVVAGGGMLAALLAGSGMRGLSKLIPGAGIAQTGLGIAKGELAKKAGADMSVYVVNAAEIGGNMAAAGTASILPFLGKAGLVGTAAGVGAGAGMGINALLDRYTQGTEQGGFQGNILERFFARLDFIMGGGLSGTKPPVNQQITIKSVDKKLVPMSRGSRGVMY